MELGGPMHGRNRKDNAGSTATKPCRGVGERAPGDVNLDRIAICRDCEHRCRIPYRICCDLIRRDGQPCSTAWSQAVRAGQCPHPDGNRFTRG